MYRLVQKTLNTGMAALGGLPLGGSLEEALRDTKHSNDMTFQL